MIEYSPIPGKLVEIPQRVLVQLSTDQIYFYEISMAIQRGKHFLDSSTVHTRRRKATFSRWLTLAKRQMRYYISQETPSGTLNQLVNFILNCYAPFIFQVKLQHFVEEGSSNFFVMLKLVQSLPQPDQEILFPILETNSYRVHSESILISACTIQFLILEIP